MRAPLPPLTAVAAPGGSRIVVNELRRALPVRRSVYDSVLPGRPCRAERLRRPGSKVHPDHGAGSSFRFAVLCAAVAPRPRLRTGASFGLPRGWRPPFSSGSDAGVASSAVAPPKNPVGIRVQPTRESVMGVVGQHQWSCEATDGAGDARPRHTHHHPRSRSADVRPGVVVHAGCPPISVEPASSARTARLDRGSVTAPVVSLRHDSRSIRWNSGYQSEVQS